MADKDFVVKNGLVVENGNITVTGTVDGRDVATDGTKLDTIETNADVTDTSNVTAAGALMDSELTNIAAVKALNQGVSTTDSPSFAGLTATTADINGGTIDNATIATSDVTVGAGKTLDVSAGTLTLANDQISGNKIQGGTIGSITITTLTGTTGNITNVNATTVDATNVEVTNIKAKDGTASATIADSTGVMTVASSVLTTTDINGGTIDGTVIGGSTPAAISGTTGQFGTSLNVDGTVTADGLTVDVAGTADIVFQRDNAVSGKLELDFATAFANFNSVNDGLTFSQNAVKALQIRGGDISFYEDTGTTPKFFWDASAESLGIGTSSPSEKLHISGTGETILVTPVAYGANQDSPYLIASGTNYNGATTNWGTYGFQHRLKVNSSGVPRVTIDTSTGELFTVANAGVGIGVESPYGKLNVNGTVYAQAGTLFNPPGTGTDTSTTSAFALDSGSAIVGVNNGYIRNMLSWTSSSDITIGQGGTSLIGGINLIPGSTGNVKVNGQRVFAEDYHPNADQWTTGRTLTIGATGKTVTGADDVSWSRNEIIGTAPTTGDWWNGNPIISGTNGVTEIGRYIDFHNTDTTTSDYTIRMDNRNVNLLNIYGSTLASTKVGIGISDADPTAMLEVAGSLKANDATFAGGIEAGSVGYKDYSCLVDFGSAVAGTWLKLVDVTSPNQTFSTIGFTIDVIDNNANQATIASVDLIDRETYYVHCVRTDATVLNNPDACYVRGMGNRIRAVKTATGVYQIQIQNEAQFKDYRVDIKVHSWNGSHTVVYSNGATASNGTAQYNASVSTGNADIFGNISTRTITTSGNIILNDGNVDGANLFFYSQGFNNWSIDNASGAIRLINNGQVPYSIDTNGTHAFRNTSGTDIMRIVSTGNVGIGTSTPEAPLTIVPGGTSTTSIGGRNINYGVNNIVLSGRTGYLCRVSNNFTGDGDNAGFMWIYPFDSGGNVNNKVFRSATGATLVDKFWVNQVGGGYFAGNVGIGTSSPQSILHARQDQDGTTRAIIQNRLATGTPVSELTFLTGTIDITDNRYAYIQSAGSASNYLAFGTSNGAAPVERMRITAGGDVIVSGGSVTIGDGTADTRLIIKRVDGTTSDDIQFFNGTTRIGEIGTQDTTWLRINQQTNKNIYTPRLIRADGGFQSDFYRNPDDTGVTTIAGGVTAGGNIELYGPNHATVPNQIFYDAVVHTFREHDASPTFATLDATNFVAYGDIVPDTDNTGNVGTSALTFSQGWFTNLTVDSTIDVRGAIDLADSDEIRFGSSDDFRMYYDGAANEMEFEMEAACNRIRIHDNGTTKFTFEKSSGIFTPVGGLYLGGTAAANLLDDYEEGTWTPEYSGQSGSPTTIVYNIQEGYYTKVGNVVTVSGRINTTSISGSFSGGIRLGGLPFTCKNVTNLGAGGGLVIAAATDFVGHYPFGGYARDNVGFFTLQTRNDFTSNIFVMDNGDMATGATAGNNMSFSATYITDQ